jgi:ABC-type uncharacterized transport system substrate-binding protein
VEYRWAEGQYDRLPQLATDFIREKVDLVVTYGSEGALAAKRSITTLPVVAVAVGDFVGAGVVTNLPRPEANITGLSLNRTQREAIESLAGHAPPTREARRSVESGQCQRCAEVQVG